MQVHQTLYCEHVVACYCGLKGSCARANSSAAPQSHAKTLREFTFNRSVSEPVIYLLSDAWLLSERVAPRRLSGGTRSLAATREHNHRAVPKAPSHHWLIAALFKHLFYSRAMPPGQEPPEPSATEQLLERALVLTLLAAMLAYLGSTCWKMRGARFVRGDGGAAAAEPSTGDDHRD